MSGRAQSIMMGCIFAITAMLFLAGAQVQRGITLLEEIKACQCAGVED